MKGILNRGLLYNTQQTFYTLIHTVSPLTIDKKFTKPFLTTSNPTRPTKITTQLYTPYPHPKTQRTSTRNQHLLRFFLWALTRRSVSLHILFVAVWMCINRCGECICEYVWMVGCIHIEIKVIDAIDKIQQ